MSLLMLVLLIFLIVLVFYAEDVCPNRP